MIDNKDEIRKHFEEIEIAKRFEEIMKILGIEKTESNENTPLRVAKMYCNELFRNRNNEHLEELDRTIKTFPNPAKNSAVSMPITVKDIPFSSTCEHHWLPFFGTVTVTYVPNERVIGLSKIPRVVKFFSQKPQIQEQLAKEIGDYLYTALDALSVTVTIKAKHCCVMCRGAESDCETETVYVVNKDNAYTDITSDSPYFGGVMLC